jgi:uncharacterized protein (DUF2249 family)
MKPINANTRIAAVLKQHPAALEAIISISPKFNKLRNPLLRKLMASRTSIGMASRIGGCSVNDFFTKLRPLGFSVDSGFAEDIAIAAIVPEFMKKADEELMLVVDVRPIIDSGKDPLQYILKNIRKLEVGQILKLINSFEPTPLIQLLNKQGFDSYVEIEDENQVHTYFHKRERTKETVSNTGAPDGSWEETLAEYKDRLKTIDVRDLEAPLPMLTILDELEKLPAGNALFVHHKRIPVFLLPELVNRKFDYRIIELGEAAVQLLVFKK